MVTLRARTTPSGCQVRIDEEPVKGPAALIPRFLTAPILRWRNAETLHRLGYLAEGRAGRPAMSAVTPPSSV